jgi:predicted O-methyltransferase YrrM
MLQDARVILDRLITDRLTFDGKGTPLQVTGAISLLEADCIREVILENDFRVCLETGVAYGASTIAICSALSVLEKRGLAVKHYGVDPCQLAVYGGAAIAALKECGLDHILELCEGPSHLMLPKLIERNVSVDFVFIDGMHTFDYTLVDLFLSDKLLRTGGVICIHDMNLPSKKKALRYLMGHRKYVRLPSVKRPLTKRTGAAFKEALNGSLRSGWSHLTTVELMSVLKKVSDFEPAWDFYVRF